MTNEEFKTRLTEALAGTEKLQKQFDDLCSLIKSSYAEFDTYYTTLSFIYTKEALYQVLAARLFLLDVEPGMLEKAHQYVKALKQG
ncbi:MAG TPA: hypothetical protein VM577_19175 [Anaerovoracaceae bacterium]|nr:hypothetical protein [Anaerovoracaceae bacterium]